MTAGGHPRLIVIVKSLPAEAIARSPVCTVPRRTRSGGGTDRTQSVVDDRDRAAGRPVREIPVGVAPRPLRVMEGKRAWQPACLRLPEPVRHVEGDREHRGERARLSRVVERDGGDLGAGHQLDPGDGRVAHAGGRRGPSRAGSGSRRVASRPMPAEEQADERGERQRGGGPAAGSVADRRGHARQESRAAGGEEVPVEGCPARGSQRPGAPRTVSDVDNRAEVRDFLVSRRADITPERAGLSSHGRRRAPGLRRSEVAALAGVSIEYYSKLERGSLGGASAGVLDAIARALQLDEAERTHLFHLAQAAAGSSAIIRPRGRGTVNCAAVPQARHDCAP